ncbi:WecB/TagA/CpsF family glycosyltransferase [Ekhidna sp.]|uniref:WecB/TagA/CpsF family glycosyltransferase n=1 Tax=Ekhidna sp. TaxID=2608089 RepID=UPI003512AEB8
MNEIKSCTILGIKIHCVTSKELTAQVSNCIETSRKEIFSNVNIHGMNIAAKNKEFKKFLADAYINFCDGDGVRLGGKILNKHIPEKITYNRWMWELAEESSLKGYSWFMVGSSNHVIEVAATKLKRKYPNLKIAGYHHGYLDDSTTEVLIREIERCQPNILIVGMGMPIQEKWLTDNLAKLSFNVALTGGAVFEYISGASKMTPNIYYKLKLEWFYRFLKEPKRLFRRYFIGNPLFVLRVLKQRISAKS